MKLRRLAIITGFILASISLPLHAADLMQAYYKALASDPTFKKANSDWESAKENLPIARAAYLTQMSLTGNAQRQFNNIDPPLAFPINNGYNNTYGFVLSVTQPIFNLPAWDAIRSAHASVKSATATFSSAGQDLMLRTVKAYVAVLQAYDQLRFQLAQKRAVNEQLKVAEQQFHVGLIAVTGVYNARSSYDQALATSIADQNALNDNVEELAEITGVHYLRLLGINKRVPLVKPQPNNINTWTDVAMRQNYSLMANSYAVIAARETIKQESTQWAPQLNMAGTYTNANNTKYGDGNFDPTSGIIGAGSGIPAISVNNVVYGLTLNFPFLQGGLVSAKTRQAQFDYLSASNQREFTYRSVISNTRQSYLGVITGISKIKADLQTVVSARNSLNATKAGYEVGTRTMADVLDDVSTLYQSEQQYADDQYNYIIDSVELKFYAGTLSVKDLQTINSWLRKKVKLNLPKEALRSLQTPLKPIKSFPAMLNVHNRKGSGPYAKRQPPIETDLATISSASTALSQSVTKPQLKLPMPKMTRHQNTAALPMPKSTRSYGSNAPKQMSTASTKPVLKAKSFPRRHAKLGAARIKPRYHSTQKKERIIKSYGSPRHRVIVKPRQQHAASKHQVVSLDQQVLPLYDIPPTGNHALPVPS